MHQKTLFIIKTTHRWIGLIGGWFLFMIMISGCLTLFNSEISQWMRPELALVKPAPLSSTALDQAYKVWLYSQNMPKNQIILPSERDPYLYVSYLKDNLKKNIILDPNQGTIIPVRDTAGASFIFSIHKKLFMNPSIGQFILLIVSFLFIISILTGIILHFKTYVKMLFNLQAKANPLRIQLNFHTTIGMLFLPFLSVMALSGFLFVAPSYLTASSSPAKITFKHHANIPYTPAHQDLLNLVVKAEHYFNNPAGFIFFTHKEIKIGEANSSYLSSFKNTVSYNNVTGAMTSHTSPSPMFGYPQKVIFGFHIAKAGGVIFRTINFILGLGSAICVALALLYYSNRYKNKIYPNKLAYIGHKTIEGINTGVIMAPLIGFISFLWINRFIPVDSHNRTANEIMLFFIIGSIIFIYGLYSAYFNFTNHALKKLLIIFSYLCLLLPVIDLMTNFTLFTQSLLNSNYLYLKMDITIFVLGVCSLLFSMFLKKKNYLI